jgi:hypothetical protein
VTVEVGVTDAVPVGNPKELERRLDEIERNLTEPVLVRLASKSGIIMHIGLGDPNYSIALFLDEAGHAWSSRGASPDARLVFLRDDHQYEFYAAAAISPMEARAAATEFVLTGRQPSTIQWEQEPN